MKQIKKKNKLEFYDIVLQKNNEVKTILEDIKRNGSNEDRQKYLKDLIKMNKQKKQDHSSSKPSSKTPDIEHIEEKKGETSKSDDTPKTSIVEDEEVESIDKINEKTKEETITQLLKNVPTLVKNSETSLKDFHEETKKNIEQLKHKLKDSLKTEF